MISHLSVRPQRHPSHMALRATCSPRPPSKTRGLHGRPATGGKHFAGLLGPAIARFAVASAAETNQKYGCPLCGRNCCPKQTTVSARFAVAVVSNKYTCGCPRCGRCTIRFNVEEAPASKLDAAGMLPAFLPLFLG